MVICPVCGEYHMIDNETKICLECLSDMSIAELIEHGVTLVILN